MRLTRLQAQQRSKGFSLIEVVVALAVLAIGVVSLIQLFSGSLRTTKKSADYSKALIYARSLMDEAYSKPEPLNAEGTFDLENGFTATRTVRFISSEERTKLYEITVTVTHPSGVTELKGIRTVYEKED